jgi:hypothetical protein
VLEVAGSEVAVLDGAGSEVAVLDVAGSDVAGSDVAVLDVAVLDVAVSGVCEGPPPPHATIRSATSAAPGTIRRCGEFTDPSGPRRGSDGKAGSRWVAACAGLAGTRAVSTATTASAGRVVRAPSSSSRS